jgi:hypothetical protein
VQIIEGVLSKHLGPGGKVVGDLSELEAEIIAAHEPWDEHFLMLCRKCHGEYGT